VVVGFPLGEEGLHALRAAKTRKPEVNGANVVHEVVLGGGGEGAAGLGALHAAGRHAHHGEEAHDDVKRPLWLVVVQRLERDKLDGPLGRLGHREGGQGLDVKVWGGVGAPEEDAKEAGKRFPVRLGVYPRRDVAVEVLYLGAVGDELVHAVAEAPDHLLEPPVHPLDAKEPRGVADNVHEPGLPVPDVNDVLGVSLDGGRHAQDDPRALQDLVLGRVKGDVGGANVTLHLVHELVVLGSPGHKSVLGPLLS